MAKKMSVTLGNFLSALQPQQGKKKKLSLTNSDKRCLMALIGLTWPLIRNFGQSDVVSHQIDLSYLTYLEPLNGNGLHWITGKSRSCSKRKRNGQWAIKSDSCPPTNGLNSTEGNHYSPSCSLARKTSVSNTVTSNLMGKRRQIASTGILTVLQIHDFHISSGFTWECDLFRMQ